MNVHEGLAAPEAVRAAMVVEGQTVENGRRGRQVVKARCPYCGELFSADEARHVTAAANAHLLSNTPCSEQLMRDIVEGWRPHDEQKPTR